MKSLVLFDLDGTLLNTIDDLGAATNHALKTMGYPEHAILSYRMMVGNGITKLIERALPDYAKDEATVKKARAAFVEYYNDHCTDATKPYPGIEDLLFELTQRGVNLGVTSNKYQQAVTRIIGHYFPDIPFKAVLGNIEGMPPKPDPSIVFAALTECPTPKDATLYVGDSGVDMETARRACVESVGVTWGFRPAKELKAAYANHIVSDPAAILDIALGNA